MALPPTPLPMITTHKNKPSFVFSADPGFDPCPHCYSAGGWNRTKLRGDTLMDPAVLAQYGAGQYPLSFVDHAPNNGNYLEPNSVAVRHGICGDPRQVGARMDYCSAMAPHDFLNKNRWS